MQRGHAFAIVDEVDSILIDEARTPLIISGMGEKSTQMYDLRGDRSQRGSARNVSWSRRDDKEEEDADIDADYVVDEKAKTATLTARGIAEGRGVLPPGESLRPRKHHHRPPHQPGHQAPTASMKRDIDYVIKDGEIIIVDEFTGRLMFGRRYSEGLHQAIEAKEHV